MLNEINKDAKARMGKTIQALENELKRIRTGRANTALLESIEVPYYGANTPLTQVAAVAVQDARTLTITPWEKSMISAVEKAIMGSDVGITPTTAGNVIRLNMPPLTEERRKELAKLVSGEGENSKISIRNIRRDSIQTAKDLLKEKEISEDDLHRFEDVIQKLTDEFVDHIDTIVKLKETELMSL